MILLSVEVLVLLTYLRLLKDVDDVVDQTLSEHYCSLTVSGSFIVLSQKSISVSDVKITLN